MKIKSDHLLKHIQYNDNNYRFILLYGPNIGLVHLLFNSLINILSIDIKDPFNVSKFDAQNLIDNPSIMSESISTFSMTSDKRIILLDLCNVSLQKNVINNIKTSITEDIDKYLVIIKADNLGAQNDLVKFTQDSKIGILVPCYEETSNQVKFELSNILTKNNFKCSDTFLSQLSTKFSNDSSINKMEFDKLKSFLINNDKISETILLNLVTDNTNLNLSKITNSCAMGEVKNALFFYEKTLHSSISTIVIIRALVKHFKTIEKILCAVEDGVSIENIINNIRPPIFFKDKPLISIQTKLWSLKKINLVLKRLSDTEIKCKSGLFLDDLLSAQLILSISVMAKKTSKI